MEIKDVEKALTEALQAPENTDLQAKYCDAVAEYLKENKSSDEILSIVIRGIDIDRAANYYDYLESASWNDLQSLMKQIRQSKEIKESKDDHAIKFLAGMLSMALMKAGNMENQCGNIITMIVAVITSEKKPLSVEIYGPILQDYVVEDLNPKVVFPQWKSIKASEDVCQQFSEILLNATNCEHVENYKSIRQWANRGLLYAEEKIKKRKIEEKIPKSRISDLTAIVEHYKAVEKQLRDSVYEIAKMQDEITGLQQQIGALQGEKRDLEGQIRALAEKVNAKQQQLDKAEKEVGERAAINEAFGALKKNDESAMLQDIANELKAEYQDFIASVSDPMDEDLGEIYREKLKNIFKILSKKGITME